jgi:hypothetical protein
MDLGSAGRGPKTKKPSVPKAWRDLRKSSKKALKLFSSFLRGASCPKSPRFKREGGTTTIATSSFIRQIGFDVKQNVRGAVDVNVLASALRQKSLCRCDNIMWR